MPIDLITGPANAGKARAVLEALRAHHARREHPLLVVPTRADTERYTRELTASGVSADARVVRFDGLIAEVVRRAGPAQPPLGALARERLLAQLSARPTRGATRALRAFLAELRVERIDAAQLHTALDAWVAADPAQRTRAQRLGELYAGYERALAELGRSDPEQRATHALDALRRTPARWHATPVLLYGFDDLTPLQLDTIETLGAVVDAHLTISLTFERARDAFAGRARTFQRLAALATAHRELPSRAEYYDPPARAALHHLERRLFEPEPPPAHAPAQIAAGDAVRLLEGGGERAELELVADEIVALLQRGVPPAEIAVAHRTPATIAELLAEIFDARAIPYTLERRARFADTALGGALLGALRVAREADAPLDPLLRWLRAPGALTDPELADQLEARARRAGVATAADALALWSAANWPTQPLEPLQRLRDAATDRGSRAAADTILSRAAHELERLATAAAAAAVAPHGASPRLGAAGASEPAALREDHALRAARAALEELRELARVDPGTLLAAARAATPGEDAAALIATLRGLELVVRAGSPEPAVAVLDPLALRARRVRALFLCGLQEGVFPAPARAEPLLSDDERRRLVETSGLLALAAGSRGVDALAAERYLFYAAVTRPEELLVLSWHTADDDGVARSRSLFVDDVRDLFTCDLHRARRRRALGELGPARAPHASAPQPQAADTLVAPAPPPPAPAPPHATAAAASPREIAPLRDARVLADLREQRLWSASALEVWAGCPARWFVERLLRARDLEPEPEPLARGALAHAALRDVLAELRRETGSARLRPEVLPRARELLAAALAAREREHPLSVAPERVPGVRRRLHVDLERYLEHAAAACAAEADRERPLEPTYLELSFGFEDEEPGLPPLELGDGVQVRGRIDRVDVDPASGAAVVYDYKSSRAPDAGRWARERSFQVALYMRAAEQLPATRVVGGFYQPLSGRDLRARGVLDEDAGLALDCVRGDTRAHDELQALVAQAVAAARHAAAEARAGALQARPRTCGFGDRGCMYPTICRCER
ncbi:MAG TPA: PD-(D/E)XK nuclease family protein [Solirubrobacteraceae bacterium]|nr:PD-(D/E)XK nuclease family protein [Solirubrobacteraceae bacterium]